MAKSETNRQKTKLFAEQSIIVFLPKTPNFLQEFLLKRLEKRKKRPYAAKKVKFGKKGQLIDK